MVAGFFLTLAIGAFSSVTASKVDKNTAVSENDEGPCSIKVNFMTNKGEEYTYHAKFQITLIFSIQNDKEYHDWIEKELGPSSIELVNLPPGLYRLHDFSFSGSFIRPLVSKYVFVGEGTLIPTHKDVTVKMIDLSRP